VKKGDCLGSLDKATLRGLASAFEAREVDEPTFKALLAGTAA
jgi:hypothetical protein